VEKRNQISRHLHYTKQGILVLAIAKQSFYRAANAIAGKVGRHASEEVILQLVWSN